MEHAFRCWPIRELLIAYREAARREAFELWQFAVVRWALLAPHQKRPDDPPPLPRILRETLRAD